MSRPKVTKLPGYGFSKPRKVPDAFLDALDELQKLLKKREYTVKELMAELGITAPTVATRIRGLRKRVAVFKGTKRQGERGPYAATYRVS